ncbi:MAG: transketolase family protein [Oryzihumus sp.]
MSDTRVTFARTAVELVGSRADTALLYAEISGQYFAEAEKRLPDRIVNVGIREQLLVSAAAVMALSGLRPIAHTFASFLVERAFEQVKLGFNHQDVGGVLVSSGGSYDNAAGGRTHQAPGDVAHMDALPDWRIHVPGHADEVADVLRQAVAGSGRDYIRVTAAQNSRAYPVRPGAFQPVRRGSRATVIAVGPMLDPVLEATAGLDVSVLYASTVRPFDSAGLRGSLGTPDVVLVEPYLAGTSSRLVSEALMDLPHRVLALGVGRTELRRYGTPAEHQAAHGLDSAGIRRSLERFLP